jgi:hypothetical protein
MRTFWCIFYLQASLGKYMTMKVYEVIAEAKVEMTYVGSADRIAELEAWAIKNGMGPATKKELVDTWLQKLGGKWLIALRLIAFVAPAAELLYHRHIIQQRYKNDPEKMQEWEDFYLGVWTAEMLVPFIVMFMRRAKWVTILAGLIVGLFTAGAVPGLAIGALAAFGPIAAEYALIEGISLFLQSPMGQQWLQKFFTELVWVGRVERETWNTLVSFGKEQYNNATGKPNPKPKPDAELNPEQKAAMKNVVFIAGVAVVDGQGHKIPMAAEAGAVKQFIKDNPNDPDVRRFLAAPN